MDIIKELWPEFLQGDGQQLIKEVEALYKVKIKGAKQSLLNFKYRGLPPIADKGRLTYGEGRDLMEIGHFWVDYTEPCIRYELYAFDNDLL